MSYVCKMKGNGDSSQSESSESPHIKVPASKSDESLILGTSSTPGKRTSLATTMFRQTCETSTQIQSQEMPNMPRSKARKTFPNSKNNLPITHLADKDQKNLETIPPPLLPITTQPVASTDSTWSSPIISKGAFCQDSPTTLTLHQLQQSHIKISTPEKDTKSTLPLENKASETETSSLPSTQGKPLKKATLAGMRTNFNRTMFSESDSGDPLDMPTLTAKTVGSKSVYVSSNGTRSNDSIADVPPILTASSSFTNSKKDNLTPKSEFEKEPKAAGTTKIAEDTNGGDKPSFEKDKGPHSDLHENVHPPTPALTPQMEDPNVEARMAALHGEPLDIVEEVVANVAHEVSINSDGSDLTIELSDSEFTPSKPALKPSRSSNKSASKTAKAPVEKKAGKPESGLSREVARLLQDEGAERIMQEMEGKGASRRRTTTKDWFSRDTRQEKRVIDVEEVKDEDEKKTKKNKRPRTDSVTATTADSFSADRNPLQHWQVVNVSFLILLFNI